MVEKRKSSTPADKQIMRLENLRVEKDRTATKKPPKSHEPSRSAVDRTLHRLERMREVASQGHPVMPPVLPMVDLTVEPRPKGKDTKKPEETHLSPETVEPPVIAVAPPPPPFEGPSTEPPLVELEASVEPPVSSAPEPVVMMAPPPPPCPPPSLDIPPSAPEPAVVVSAPPPPPPSPVEQPIALSEEAPGEMHPTSRASFPRFDGRYKNVKLSVAQMKTLEQLFEVDPRLYPARILRLSLNQWLGMNNLAEDQALEPLSRDALIRIQKGL